jgi:hypothetical protein
MQAKSLFHCLTSLIFLTGFSLNNNPILIAQSHQNILSAKQIALRGFLQSYLKDSQAEEDKSAEYRASFVDLKDDGTQEVIVYVSGRDSCGSGGCSALVLAPQGSSYRVVTELTITRLPIRVLSTKSHGWRDISVRVQGGGIIEPYDAKLMFDGTTYPDNPSVPPAQKITNNVKGQDVISSATKGIRLYP